MESAGETFGVAVVRVWRSDDQLLIRVIANGSLDDEGPAGPGYATDSVDDALQHLRGFIESVGS